MKQQLPSIPKLEEGTFLLLDKPLGWTSFDVVGKIRKIVRIISNKIIKIGHTGTLDPLATGLLILCTGKYTKKVELFQEYEKEYEGKMILGAITPSYDMETPVIKNFDISFLTETDIIKQTSLFVGQIYQLPPTYSAVKINGRRAYKYARTGKEIEIKPRLIEIKQFEITSIQLPEISFKVTVSKGAYVRALARDFGESLNCGAYLSSLRRTRIGKYKIEDAYSIKEIEEYYQNLK